METTQTVWALGDYHRFAKDLIWGFGSELVVACGIGPGQRVRRRARVGASGRRRPPVRRRRVRRRHLVGRRHLRPDHQAVADELVRVCRPGGTIGLITFTPEGMAGDFFALFGRYAPPPPPGAQPPILWGVEEHVRELFGDRLSALEMTRRQYVERRPGGSQGFLDYYKETFGPVVATYATLDDERRAALDAEALAFVERWNTGEPGGVAELPVEYLFVVART